MLTQDVTDCIRRCVTSRHEIVHNGNYYGHLYILTNNTAIFRIGWSDRYWTTSPQQDFIDAVSLSDPCGQVNQEQTLLLVDCLIHENLPAEFVDDCARILEMCFDKVGKIVLAYNNCAFDLMPSFADAPRTQFVGINFFAAFMNYHYEHSDFEWNPQDQILLLLGRPYKYNRLPVLYEFWKQQLIDNLTYSFSPVPFVNNEQIESDDWIQEGIQVLESNTSYQSQDFDYSDWAKSLSRTLDRPLSDQPGVSTNFNGTDVPTEIYTRCCVEVVPETHYCQPWFLTEKTYRPLVMGFPLLHVGYHHSEWMLNLGLEIFEPLTCHDCEYDSHDTAHHVNQIPKTVTASKTFLDSARTDTQEIRRKILHNQLIVKQIAEQQIQKLEECVPEFTQSIKVFLLDGK